MTVSDEGADLGGLAGLSFTRKPSRRGRSRGPRRRTRCRLTLLAPEIVEAVLKGHQPAGMTVVGLLVGFPVMWAEQGAVLGVDRT